MSLLNLLCPHCGGNFDLDSERPLQSFWVCPYCGNRSLMQKHDGTIRLRGIIPGRAQTATQTPTATVQDYSFNIEPETQMQEPEQAEVEDLPDFLSPVSQHTRPLEEIIAEVSSAVLKEQLTEPEEIIETVPPSDQPAVSPLNQVDQLCQLAEDAAASHDLPLFNAYSRQALDLDPKDPRIYILRSELSEEADAFARATWASLGWSLLTPKRKTALVAQQLYNLNTALKYSRKSRQPDIISRFAWQIIRQAIDHFTEQGQLRCQKRLFFKTFKGRFKRRDLQMSYCFLDSLRLINRQTCPLAFEELLGALRVEISKAPPRIARRLRKL
jgi:DNA-directed RNA polymerase subunit RPC12/RpoP